MGNEVAIDTNVLLVADGAHAAVSPACVLACTKHLRAVQQHGIVVVDDGYRILGEYRRNLEDRPGKGVGQAFWKWLAQNVSNRRHVNRVRLTETSKDHYAEFPDKELEAGFDPSDRMFVAVANAHPAKPPIWQAADSKWLGWWQALAANGVRVIFLCPDDVVRWYRGKFPNQPVPKLPP